MVWGSRCMCIRHTPHWGWAATTAKAPGCRKAQMSLTISAPRSSTARITAGLYVSTEIGTPSTTASRTSGTTRASSSSKGTAGLPGRVDSPPMSRISAPSLSNCSQCRNAAMVEAWCPPSEKESGVTLTMPMTLGRSRSMEKREVCQIMKSLPKSPWSRRMRRVCAEPERAGEEAQQPQTQRKTGHKAPWERLNRQTLKPLWALYLPPLQGCRRWSCHHPRAGCGASSPWEGGVPCPP